MTIATHRGAHPPRTGPRSPGSIPPRPSRSARGYGRLDDRHQAYLDYTGGGLYAAPSSTSTGALLRDGSSATRTPAAPRPAATALAERHGRDPGLLRRLARRVHRRVHRQRQRRAQARSARRTRSSPASPVPARRGQPQLGQRHPRVRASDGREPAALHPARAPPAARRCTGPRRPRRRAPDEPACSPTPRSPTTQASDIRSPGSSTPSRAAGTSCSTRPRTCPRTASTWTAGGRTSSPVSWYKVFGYPTGIGSLIVRREALARLRRPWFAGGRIGSSRSRCRSHTPGPRDGVRGRHDRLPGPAGHRDRAAPHRGRRHRRHRRPGRVPDRRLLERAAGPPAPRRRAARPPLRASLDGATGAGPSPSMCSTRTATRSTSGPVEARAARPASPSGPAASATPGGQRDRARYHRGRPRAAVPDVPSSRRSTRCANSCRVARWERSGVLGIASVPGGLDPAGEPAPGLRGRRLSFARSGGGVPGFDLQHVVVDAVPVEDGQVRVGVEGLRAQDARP